MIIDEVALDELLKIIYMKRNFTLMSFLFLSFVGFSQTIEVLKFNDKESLLKLSNGEIVSIPLKNDLNLESNGIAIKDKSVSNNNKKLQNTQNPN